MALPLTQDPMASRISVVCFTVLTIALLTVACQPLTGDATKDDFRLDFGLFSPKKPPADQPPRLQLVHFASPVSPSLADGPVILRAARNETISFALQINRFEPRSRGINSLRFTAPARPDGVIPAGNFSAAQVLPMPVNTNRAGFIRHTAISSTRTDLPRALLPMDAREGVIALDSLRSAADPANPQPRLTRNDAAPVIWIDVQIPPTVPAGVYEGKCELVEQGDSAASVPITIVVEEFVIPDQRHLLMAGMLDWPGLARLYPRQFSLRRVDLLSRKDPNCAAAIKVLDDIVKLAQAHRLQVVVPRLQPTVKWPSGKAPQIDFADFDSIVSPWLTGEAFADQVPLGYWPLPQFDGIEQYGAADQADYYRAAAAHFDQFEWLSRSGILIDSPPGRARLAESFQISWRAADLLKLNPRLRVMVPLQEEQVQVASAANPRGIPPEELDRLVYAAPGLVSVPPMQRLPDWAAMRSLRTDLPGLVPYIGAGADEREVRLWAWLAFLNNAQFIHWPSVLPPHDFPQAPASPDDLIWFYPGSWFGMNSPVPTLQLKWLRRAQQDYEYLWLAHLRGQTQRARTLARLVTRPVELQPMQAPDATYGLLSGTNSPTAWNEALELLSRTIILAQPGQAVDEMAARQLSFDIATWSNTQAKPLLMPRITNWSAGIIDARNQSWANLTLGVDVYNAAEREPEKSVFAWSAAPDGWVTQPDPIELPQLAPYKVNRLTLDARINLSALSTASRTPVRLAFTDGHTRRQHVIEAVLPVAPSEQRQGASPKIDGLLGDWMPEDALHEGKLVKMLSRPAVQDQKLQLADTDSAVYSTWTPAMFYLGFRVEGINTRPSGAERNYVQYDFRRAWGEDVCEILIQPIYENNEKGPLLHVACKPRGQVSLMRRLDTKLADPWQAFSGTGVAYESRTGGSTWRGEIAIPWEAIHAPGEPRRRPLLLRFNFVQHRGADGQSASWAGPVDFGRDEHFTGLLDIRRPVD